jgi:ATP-dependent RNA helicase DDX3X
MPDDPTTIDWHDGTDDESDDGFGGLGEAPADTGFGGDGGFGGDAGGFGGADDKVASW